MDTALFLEQFGHLAGAPDGLQKLRSLILDLAVRGKLVEQNADDKPASELLKCIEIEKKRLVKAGEIGKPKKFPPISTDEIPYELPHGWEWTLSGRISLSVQYGFTASADSNIPSPKMIRITDIQNNYVNWDTVPGCVIKEDKIAQYKLQSGDILIARTGGTIGKTYLMKDVDVEAVFASYLIRIRFPESIVPQYAKHFLESPLYWKQLIEKSKGTGQPNVNGTSLSQLVMPLPPLAEQQRIVARVDELMQLCDQLEAEQAERDHLRERATKSTLYHLSNASSKADARKYWNYTEQHFPELFDRVSTVEDLRATILQLAVQGRLVPQNPDDEPASELIQKLLNCRREDWEHVYASGYLEEGKSLPGNWKSRYKEPQDPILENLPTIPKEWTWISIEAAAYRIVDCLHSTPKFTDNGFMCIDTTCISPGKILYDKVRYVDEETFHERNRRMIPESGDVMFSREGSIGTAVIVPSNTQICLGQRLMIFRLNKYVDSEYFEHVLNSNLFRDQYLPKISGTASPHLNISEIRRMAIPLPSLDEQKRIVSTANELMQLCNQLAEETETVSYLSGQLFDSIIHHMFEDSE